MSTKGDFDAFPCMDSTPKRRWFQFSLRTLLLVMTVAALLMGRITYLRKMAEFHHAETDRLQKHRQFLNSVSFDTPQKEWLRLDDLEVRHSGLAIEFERAVWRPWTIVDDRERLDPVR